MLAVTCTPIHAIFTHARRLQASSMADAEKQIDEMAKEGKIDPAFLYTMARAYSGVKETDYTRDDVKETMAHLYVKAKEAAARDSPAEVRILKHLLMIDDPAHRSKELERAFEPVSPLSSARAGVAARVCAAPAALFASPMINTGPRTQCHRSGTAAAAPHEAAWTWQI